MKNLSRGKNKFKGLGWGWGLSTLGRRGGTSLEQNDHLMGVEGRDEEGPAGPEGHGKDAEPQERSEPRALI